MSETTAPVETGSAMNEVVEQDIGIINGLDVFATMTRGALPTGPGLVCEPGPTTPNEVYLDKSQYIPLDLTINGKHGNLKTLSNDMALIFEDLTRRKTYPSGTGWQIVDIAAYTWPEVIGRESNNQWLMAGSLSVRYYLTGSESE